MNLLYFGSMINLQSK